MGAAGSLKPLKTERVFWRFVEREGVRCLETAEFERFRFPSLKQHPLFDFIVAHGGLETNCGVWSLARKLKILGRLRLFRLVVTPLPAKVQDGSLGRRSYSFQAVLFI